MEVLPQGEKRWGLEKMVLVQLDLTMVHIIQKHWRLTRSCPRMDQASKGSLHGA